MIEDSWRPLFHFLAEYIRQFLQTHDIGFEHRKDFHRLAFTFSYTVEQHSLSSGTLLKWDKGFSIPTAVGKDPCRMLQEELDALDVPVLVSALANDTVGTYMTQQYVSGGSCALGAVFGTGTNGAYLEKASNISKMDGSDGTKGASHMVINTEWGGLDDQTRLLPITQFDYDVDGSSLNPGEQIYEKLVSGMYLGEIFRRAVLAARGGAAGPSVSTLPDSSPLLQPWAVSTSLMSTLATRTSAGSEQATLALQSALQANNLSSEEVQGMVLLANAVGLRAARLAGVAIGAVIIKTGALQAQVSKTPRTKDSVTVSIHQEPRPGCLSLLRRMLRVKLRCFKRRIGTVSWSNEGVVRKETEDGVVTVGLDGTLAASYPGFAEGILSTLRQIPEIGVEGEKRIRIALVPDGSSVGAALVAQSAE
jgi:hexokinase